MMSPDQVFRSSCLIGRMNPATASALSYPRHFDVSHRENGFFGRVTWNKAPDRGEALLEGQAVVTVQEPQKHRAIRDEVVPIHGRQAATVDPAVTRGAENHAKPRLRNVL